VRIICVNIAVFPELHKLLAVDVFHEANFFTIFHQNFGALPSGLKPISKNLQYKQYMVT
jgi:hypothetical protein